MRTPAHILIFWLALLSLSSSRLIAQNDSLSSTTRQEFLQHPGPFSSGSFSMSLGLSLTILPRTIVEEEIRQAPMLDVQLRYGLPANFSVIGRVGSNVLTNLATLGLQWSYSFGDVSIAIGDQQAFWYGFSEFEAFDINAEGWLNIPFIAVGADVGDCRILTRAELDFITFQKTVSGDITARSNRNVVNGVSVLFAIEQPFWKNQHVTLGLKANITKQMYQGWLAFSTFNTYFLYPEFTIGFIL